MPLWVLLSQAPHLHPPLLLPPPLKPVVPVQPLLHHLRPQAQP
jgi:hypothetical protein